MRPEGADQLAHFGATYCNGFELAGLFHHPDKSAWLSSMTSKTRQLMISANAATTTPFSRGAPLAGCTSSRGISETAELIGATLSRAVWRSAATVATTFSTLILACRG